MVKANKYFLKNEKLLQNCYINMTMQIFLKLKDKN